MKKSEQRYSAKFLEIYGGMALYYEDWKRIYTIDHEDIHLFKKKGWALIGLPHEPDGGSTDHKYFPINGNLFDRIMATYQNEYS